MSKNKKQARFRLPMSPRRNFFNITSRSLKLKMLISTFRLADSARLVISMAILFSNPLQFYVAISIIFPSLVAPYVRRDKHVLAEYGLRYGILLFCCKYQNLFNFGENFVKST